jgi:peptide/nickel transport system permease protein
LSSYIVKRTLILIPSVFIISVLAFILSRLAPQDPVELILDMRGVSEDQRNQGDYEKVYRELGRHLPLFYLSIKPSNYPSSLNQLSDEQERVFVEKMLRHGYTYLDSRELFNEYVEHILRKSATASATEVNLIRQLEDKPEHLVEYLHGSNYAYKRRKLLVPKIQRHGTNNQYHRWLVSAFTKGFGISYVDGRTAISKVKKAIQWTLSFTLIDFVISVILGIAAGLFLAYNPQGTWQRLLRNILYAIYAVPLFWLATVLVVYFTTNDYGTWTKIFPSVGMDIYPGRSTARQILLNFDKLLLPIICLTLHSLAYVSRMVENSLTSELGKDYVIFAFSQGISRKHILTKHVLPNAMIPSITLYASAFASAFSGSLVLEVIFNIPGMGRLLFTSLNSADWNVVFCVLIILSIVTIVSYLIADILYVLFNPKIRFS